MFVKAEFTDGDSENTYRLLNHINRGGPYGHYWYKDNHRSDWLPASNPSQNPIGTKDIYSCVYLSKMNKEPHLSS
jgi:hypothetical protein